MQYLHFLSKPKQRRISFTCIRNLFLDKFRLLRYYYLFDRFKFWIQREISHESFLFSRVQMSTMESSMSGMKIRKSYPQYP
jgi:hypothetical protein